MTTQVSTTAYDRLLCSLQDDAVLGIYRVRLENIELPTIPQNRRQNVSRLKKVFLTQRCFRYDPQNYIKATIRQDIFDHHCSIVRSSDGLNELLLRAEDSVSCEHGSCRIKAAKLVLRGQNRWWTVVLYRENIGGTPRPIVNRDAKLFLDPRAHSRIHDDFANQLPPPDGAIYVNLQNSLRDNDLARTDRWRAYLTTDKRRYLRQLCNSHGGLIDAFNRLLPMESLFLGKSAFHIGVFHKLGRLHCDDVCLCP